MTRQQIWQLARIEEGLCSICGREPLLTKSCCEACQELNRERARNKYRLKVGIPMDSPISNRGRRRIVKK